MRYRDRGEVHRDFHLATDTTIRWVLAHLGEGALAELFRRTAQRVYADIHRRLVAGDPSGLVEHWRYYLGREGGDFSVTERDGEIRLHVRDCPAARHIKERRGAVERPFHLQTILMNAAWSEGTPFEIATEVLGERECVTVLRRKPHAAQ